MASWEHFAHGADIGVRGTGSSVAEAFEQAALAMIAVVAAPESVRLETTIEIRCSGGDTEDLLVGWLNAVVFEMSTRRMLFAAFRVRVGDGEIVATATGEPIDAARHEPVVEVKGATYTALEVRRLPDGQWLAQCVVDV
jgi:SHS2 domain-containing protein